MGGDEDVLEVMGSGVNQPAGGEGTSNGGPRNGFGVGIGSGI